MQAPNTDAGTSATVDSTRSRWIVPFGLLFLVDFIVSVIMLATDKNLQTDFGGSKPYYAHWYGVLGMAVLDLVGGLTLLALAVVNPLPTKARNMRRWILAGGLGWTILAILAMVGIVETWQQVGFASMSQFSQYLFGVNAYPGALSYIPWLYDLLLGLYVITAVAGVAAIAMTREKAPVA